MPSNLQALPEASAFLREELLSQIKKNPGFSLRAFARNLQISPGYLSQILNNRKILSEEKAYLIVHRISWAEKKKRLFINLVRLQGSKDLKFREHLLGEIQKDLGSSVSFHDLRVDEFKLIADWYHAAIMELTHINFFSLTPQSVAERLGISMVEAREALQRLLRLGLLSDSKDGIVRSKAHYQIKDVSSEAIRFFHAQNLRKAQEALRTQSLEKREFYSTTMAINPAKIKKAKALIHRFSTEIMECLEEGSREHLYQFNVQLFQIDHNAHAEKVAQRKAKE